jgi:2-oxoglutarate dehydrogenase E2 component (dihydrolipoamide succinyltransferase)
MFVRKGSAVGSILYRDLPTAEGPTPKAPEPKPEPKPEPVVEPKAEVPAAPKPAAPAPKPAAPAPKPAAPSKSE